MKLTAQVKLLPTPEQTGRLKQTLEAANAACNTMSETETVSIWVLGGREVMPYQCGDHQRALLKHWQGESDLVYRDGAFYLLATCEIDEPTPAQLDAFLGVDAGIVNLATPHVSSLCSSMRLSEKGSLRGNAPPEFSPSPRYGGEKG